MYAFYLLILAFFEVRNLPVQRGPVLASGCITAATQQRPSQRFEFSHPQMGTVFRLVFYTDLDTAAASALAHRVFARVDTLNSIFSDYQPESELNRLSDRAGTSAPMPVSAELEDILRRACPAWPRSTATST